MRLSDWYGRRPSSDWLSSALAARWRGGRPFPSIHRSIVPMNEDMTTLLANQRWLYKIADGLFFIHGGHWLIIAEKCLELLA